jgi:hypothetical protein
VKSLPRPLVKGRSTLPDLRYHGSHGMAPSTFADHSAVLFGRAPDLLHLTARAQNRGITAVLGRPRMGKTWLLTELARRLSENPRPGPSSITSLHLGERSPCLVGFSDPEGSTPDQMLRAVADLYTRWLADSTYREQAQVVYEQQKADWVGKTGEAVGSILKSVASLGVKSMEAVADVVNKALNAMAAANRDLVSGGIQLPRLQSDQTRDLLALLHKITSYRVVLVLDQWEKSPNLDLEGNILDSFLRHLDEWPPCHIFLGVRFSPEIDARLRTMRGGFSRKRAAAGGPMDIYELPSMHLEEANSEATRLLQHLRTSVSAASSVSDEELLRMVSGYPGTVETWTAPQNASLIDSSGKLQEYADDANNNHYVEFDSILLRLEDRARPVAMRLALLPGCANPEHWKVLKPIVLDSAAVNLLDKLTEKGVLQAPLAPTFGHATRGEAACRWFAERCPAEFGEICEDLIFRLAEQIQDAIPQVLPYAMGLFAISSVGGGIAVSRTAEALLVANRANFQDRSIDSLKLTSADFGLIGNRSKAMPLLAMGLFNTLVYAKRENELTLRDALLDELRTLAETYPNNSAVREWLANGLVNTLSGAKEEKNLARRDALLEELRTLAKTYPDNSAVREQLASGLFNTFNYAKEENDLVGRDALLDELRTLAGTYSDDAAVRVRLACGLFNTLIYAKEENDRVRRDSFLDELRTLAGRYPNDSAAREPLARGLLNTLVYAKEEKDLVRRDALLDALRTLANARPDDAAVRERLTKGLLKTLNDAKDEKDLARRDALLDELRSLATSYSDDAAVRENLAMGLYNTLVYAKEENDLARSDALLEELRMLAQTWPDDPKVQKIWKLAESLD